MEFGSCTKHRKDSFGCWEVSSSSPGDIVLDLCCCCSVPNSCLTLWRHGLQNARLLYPSLSPRACSDSCLLSECCYLTISSTSAPLFFCLQSFPASGFFSVSQLCGQSIETSASASVLPMNIQGWFPLRLIGLISLQSKELSRVFSSTTIWKYSFKCMFLGIY